MKQMFDDKQVKALAKEVFDENNVLPEPPTVQGNYMLLVNVDADGKVSYSYASFNIPELMEQVLAAVAGYDAEKLQTLKNVYHTFSWVEDE